MAPRPAALKEKRSGPGTFAVLGSHDDAGKKGGRRSWLIKVAALALVTCAVAALLRFADRRHLGAVVAWVDAHRARGAVLLVALHIACTVCLVPTAVLAIAAGALFGFWPALALIWLACVIGETLAFALGRHLLRAHIEAASARWPAWVALEAALREDGWKLVLLLRCCPMSPFTLLNYALGSTSLPFGHFFWPSVVGIAPGIAVFVYGGSLVRDLSDVAADAEGALRDATSPRARAAFAGVSGATALAVLIGSAWYTKRALARRIARVGGGGGGDAEAGRCCSPKAAEFYGQRQALLSSASLSAALASPGAWPASGGVGQRVAAGGAARAQSLASQPSGAGQQQQLELQQQHLQHSPPGRQAGASPPSRNGAGPPKPGQPQPQPRLVGVT